MLRSLSLSSDDSNDDLSAEFVLKWLSCSLNVEDLLNEYSKQLSHQTSAKLAEYVKDDDTKINNLSNPLQLTWSQLLQSSNKTYAFAILQTFGTHEIIKIISSFIDLVDSQDVNLPNCFIESFHN